MTKVNKIKILLLEDNDRDRDRITKNLTVHGWETDSVKNSKEFKIALSEKNYDIFVIDFDIEGDRGTKEMGGAERTLNLLESKLGVAPVVIYSGNLQSEIDEANLIKKGASFILKKGEKGSALSSLIQKIIAENGSNTGLKIKSYLANRIGDKTFYMTLIEEKKIKKKNSTISHLVVEVQRLYDEKPSKYEIQMDEKGNIINAKIKTT